MSEIRVVARLKIHEGKLEEFERVANDCLETIREKDTGTLEHSWYLNPEKTECVILERYRSSDALLEHMGNLGELFGSLLGISDASIEVFGEPSEQLVEAAADLQPTYYTRLGEM